MPKQARLDVSQHFSQEQIIGLLRQAEAGPPVHGLGRKHGFSEASCYPWRNKVGGMTLPEGKRLKESETGNRQLSERLAVRVRESHVVTDKLRKKWWPHRSDGNGYNKWKAGG